MPTSAEYRAKAAEFAELARTAHDPEQARGFQERAQSLEALADNEQWLAKHDNAVVHDGDHQTKTIDDENDVSEGGRQLTQ